MINYLCFICILLHDRKRIIAPNTYDSSYRFEDREFMNSLRVIFQLQRRKLRR